MKNSPAREKRNGRRRAPTNAPGVRAKKSLGQNFLMHASIAERIADASGIGKNDTVLEIGPGTGMLTRALLSRVKKVIAVETDHALLKTLEETFASDVSGGRLILHGGDIRTFDQTLLPKKYALVANIPYYITGEILRLFLSGEHKPSSMTLLVQKEVAERIARSKKESLLSLSVKAYGTPRFCFTVPRGAFVPAPKVDSAVLSITGISRKQFESTKHEERFFGLLRAGFAHKRKRLASNLAPHMEKNALLGEFRRLSLLPGARAEDLSLSAWLSLSKENP